MIYNQKLFDLLVKLNLKFHEINNDIQNSLSDFNKIKKLNKSIKDLTPIIDLFLIYKKNIENYIEDEKIINSKEDEELIQLAKMEINELKDKIFENEKNLKLLLIPKDENDDKNVIVEMRPAAGGDEASIFVGDLFDTYKRFCDANHWKIKLLEVAETSFGYNFISFIISGNDVYSKMKFESGVHRVQRVPATESKGRVHTSTITVAVLPEVEDVEIIINPVELRIDTYRASGAGGQHVNRTESAVRITHMPTGIFAACQEGKSQIENRETALKMLKAKLWKKANDEKNENIASLRKNQVGAGERAEKIRTYNYPQNRITDHRINLTLNKLDQIMLGNLYEIIDLLRENEEANKMLELNL